MHSGSPIVVPNGTLLKGLHWDNPKHLTSETMFKCCIVDKFDGLIFFNKCTLRKQLLENGWVNPNKVEHVSGCWSVQLFVTVGIDWYCQCQIEFGIVCTSTKVVVEPQF